MLSKGQHLLFSKILYSPYLSYLLWPKILFIFPLKYPLKSMFFSLSPYITLINSNLATKMGS